MSMGTLLRNVNECGDATDKFLLGVGMLLRNFNEHGDTSNRLYITGICTLTQTLCILITIYTIECHQDYLQPWMSVDLELMLLI